jgi:site-specific recombinase XerD
MSAPDELRSESDAEKTKSTDETTDKGKTTGLPSSDGVSDKEAERALNAIGHFESELAESTRRTYERGWRDFQKFCETEDRRPLPASQETVVLYINERFGKHTPNTIESRLSAIQHFHKEAEVEDPTRSRAVRAMMKGVRRNSEHKAKEAEPLLTRHIKEMVDSLRKERPEKPDVTSNRLKGDRLRSLRDEGVLLIGYAGALRRSEIAAMEKEHLVERDDGYALLIPESKTDQEGEGHYVGIHRSGSPYCPCEALERWMVAADINAGALFRGVHWKGAVMEGAITPRTVNNIIENAAEKASLSVKPSGHSLRAGYITQCTINGVPDGVIRAQSRHEDHATFYGYQRVHKALDESGSKHLDI